jgi:hypothetical protein
MAILDVIKTIGSLPVEIGRAIAQNPVGFVTDELLGVDDFRRALKYAAEGDALRALKSAGAGTFEIGSTILPAGSLIKGAKAGKTVAQTLKGSRLAGRVPMRAGIISSIPGLTRATEAGAMITPGGINALRALRAGEIGQWTDFANSIGSMAGLPGPNIGTRGVLAQEMENEARRRAAAEQFRQIMMGYQNAI